MCGIVGLLGHGPVNTRIYDALTVLQHRGQDAAGIATLHRGRVLMRKGNGLVKDVFRTRLTCSMIPGVRVSRRIDGKEIAERSPSCSSISELRSGSMQL